MINLTFNKYINRIIITMKKVIDIFKEHWVKIILFLIIVILWNRKSVLKERSELYKSEYESKITKLEDKVDSLSGVIKYNEKINPLLVEKMGYEISYRLLYDENSIVRSVARPDDRMKSYTDKIEQLNEKIKEVKK